jgi:hypothetical protein
VLALDALGSTEPLGKLLAPPQLVQLLLPVHRASVRHSRVRHRVYSIRACRAAAGRDIVDRARETAYPRPRAPGDDEPRRRAQAHLGSRPASAEERVRARGAVRRDLLRASSRSRPRGRRVSALASERAALPPHPRRSRREPVPPPSE